MDCTRCEELLLERVEKRLQPSERLRLDTHLVGCARCQELSLLLASAADGAFTVPDGFAEAVLSRTASPDRLAGVLRRLDRDLPALASGQVDESFVADVMAATVIADRNRFPSRIAAFWQGLLQRPRLAIEGAYAVALTVFLLFALPSSPLAALPRSAMEQLGEDRAAVQMISSSARRATALGRDTWSLAGQLLADGTAAVSTADIRALADSTLARISRRAGAWLTAFWDSALGRGLAWLLSPWWQTPGDPFDSPDPLPDDPTVPDEARAGIDRLDHPA